MSDLKYISVLFEDEKPMLEAVRLLVENKNHIADVLTPFPVHGLDELLSIRRSRIPVGGFFLGALGTISAFGFQTWVFTVSYPLIVGGKPFFSAPAFIPITFECTVLFAGISMTAAMLIRSHLKPDIRFKPLNERITDDQFVILIDNNDGTMTPEKIQSILGDIKPLEINNQTGK